MTKPTTFSFQVAALPEAVAGSETENRRFCIQPQPGAMAQTYRDLFQVFGFSGNGQSWSEHLQAMVEEEEPELFDHLEFVADASRCLVFADSQAAVNRFLALLGPRFADLHLLRRHFSLLDSEDFFE